MNPFDYTVSLRLSHPEMPAAAFTAALGMEPWRSWDAGSPRARPNGDPLGGVDSATFWTCRIGEGRARPGESFASGLAALIERLEPRRDLFQRLRDTGGTAELFVGLFGSGNIGFTLPPALLARLSDLGLALALDIYDDDDREDDAPEP